MLWPFRKRSWKTHFQRGMASGVAGDLSKATQHFRNAVRLAPNEPYPHYELGYTLLLMGEIEPALSELRRTNELAQGFFLVQSEIYVCEAILSGALDEDSVNALRQLQQLTDAGQAQSQRAVELSQQVTARAPSCPLGYYFLGKALLRTDTAEAQRALQKCMNLSPDDTTAIDALTHIGMLRKETGDLDGAKKAWSDVVTRYKGNPHTKLTEVLFLNEGAV
jgi:tetratricopeptide (TPR) repeat protein